MQCSLTYIHAAGYLGLCNVGAVSAPRFIGETMKQFAQMPKQDLPEASQPLLNTSLLNGYLSTSHRPIPAPEPDPEPNPAPDSIWPWALSGIALVDWNALLCALQERLEQCARTDQAGRLDATSLGQHEPIATIVSRCAHDMGLLCSHKSTPKNGSLYQSGGIQENRYHLC